MMQTVPLTREVVLIGGGHTHALVLRRWGMRPIAGARLTLINPGPTAPYTGMLPGFVAGHYAREDLSIDLVRLARFAGARLILGAVEGIDRDARRIRVPGRPPVAYDLASINVGITSDPPDLPGFSDHAVAAKPLGPYATAWTAFRGRAADGRADPTVAVIGAGVGGVELSMAMAHALRQDGHAPRVTVIEKNGALPGLGDGARRALLANMDRLGVDLIEGAAPTRIDPDAVQLEDGRTIPAAFTTGAAGARPFRWLTETGLDLDDGFVCVDRTLRTSDPGIYAAGDCARLTDPRPKAGVFAVRQAPVLSHNLRAELTGEGRRPYRPQGDYLKLVSLGGKRAVADKWGLRIEGRWLWRWKDRIDRRFMDRFRDLPPMPAPGLPSPRVAGLREAMGEKPMCGGCGAKVGGGTLSAVLADLPRAGRDDILSRPGDDAAVLSVGGTRQVVTTDHLRAFTGDPVTMARITAIHAMGDIWAMGARPQAALAQIILPRMTEAMQTAWLAEIMAAAAEVFADAGAEIVGGHTTLGAELTLGFSVTGLLDRAPITLSGARPGDALILTRPLGSGTILAAEMALRARGDHVAAALGEMQRPQDRAAAILSEARAMTDVTGFGLAGHLMGICEASGTGAALDLAALPLYDGAEALAAAGIRSTLYPANRAVAARMTLPDTPRAALLFDPQTAGGLLAAVPADAADTRLAALREAGDPAARIGTVTDGPPFIAVR